ncbi:nuclear transport factor 2 family protein [Sphingomonas koreensis]|uniref:Nuclear transport factor 2 family protein n=2 Tax=Sphingomonas koreensis TaxID=93064 RepID=A0AAJ4RZ91_9SPHN|nr:nuclear transport factor 2 family protein [Sphingomonas koreensis]RSU19504.1 nuclear transport factor 2 family protein [Sphingomonas koreensis]RSU20936.1 nuclear transport factor 2 family protein [Sphingomonas koreensis]RSU27882.1 nuclear transport factor 2 family protein [Sphingomonas koreensis]RSU33064.1 nuclear transport factor 2 family protein [Sphingomonas koreensis]
MAATICARDGDRMTGDIIARLGRIEAIEAIRQLAFGYALCVDARDLDALVSLYVDDVRVGEGKQGRPALRETFDAALRQFTTSAHHVTNHLIELLGPDDAIGLVSCRIEHEVGPDWVTASLLYHDRYARRNGIWLFRGRVQARLYATAQDDPRVGPAKMRWPGAPVAETGFYDPWPSWAEYWDGGTRTAWNGEGADLLVSRLRRGTRLPPPPRYIFRGQTEE